MVLKLVLVASIHSHPHLPALLLKTSACIKGMMVKGNTEIQKARLLKYCDSLSGIDLH